VRKKVRLGVQKRKKEIFDLALLFFILQVIGIQEYPLKGLVVNTEEATADELMSPKGE